MTDLFFTLESLLSHYVSVNLSLRLKMKISVNRGIHCYQRPLVFMDDFV